MSERASAATTTGGGAPSIGPLAGETWTWAWSELLEAMPDAVLATDDKGVVVANNSRATEMFGYSTEELVGSSVDTLVTASPRRAHGTYHESRAEDPTARKLTARLGMRGRRSDGSEFDVEISLAPVMTGHGRLVIAAVRDITALLDAKAAEQESRIEEDRERFSARAGRARRLENLGLLAGSVAHDFNNLLAVIINYTALVERQLGPSSEVIDDDAAAAAREDLREVRQAGERAAALTRELLAFSREEPLSTPATVDAAALVRGASSLLERSIGTSVRLKLDLPDEPIPVRIDPSRFEQVLFNLVINSRDAMPAGGTIRVQAARVEIDAAYGATRRGLSCGDFLRVTVSDEGVGMSPDVIASAFDPFFTTKESGKGSGLGLSTVYGLVREAGGDVKIHSDEGVGTTVTVTLPCPGDEPEPQHGQHSEPTAIAASRGMTVLLAEDEASLRRATARMLRDAGFDVVEAADGYAALALTRDSKRHFDLVLTDAMMPGLTGIGLAARLAGEQPGLAVLLMSGYVGSGAAGADTRTWRMLAKPFTEVELLAAVDEELSDA